MNQHPTTPTDLGKPCVVYTASDQKCDGVLVGITFEKQPTCDVRVTQGVLKSVPAENVRLV